MAKIVACPQCKEELQLPEELIGETVQCPSCQHAFQAQDPGNVAPPDEEFAEPEPEGGDELLPDAKKPAKRKAPDKSKGGTFKQLMAASKYKVKPHRGPMILSAGICSLMCVGIFGMILGAFAYYYGTDDLNEMYSGRMDPKGEQLTKVGKLLGTIGFLMWAVLSVVVILACCFSMMLAPGGARR